LVVFGPPSVWLKRMNGFSPVKITRLGSAGIEHPSLETEDCTPDGGLGKMLTCPAARRHAQGIAAGTPV
jgi:hypothetical protein